VNAAKYNMAQRGLQRRRRGRSILPVQESAVNSREQAIDPYRIVSVFEWFLRIANEMMCFSLRIDASP
jgi:hypothetical protein